MIRVFDAFCKSKFNSEDNLNLINEFYNTLNISNLTCPNCGAKHNCTPFASYSRCLITLENNLPVCHRISITRVKCQSCQSTHAVIPDLLIPFGSYALSFILTVLKAYFLKLQTIETLCQTFQISISTLYGWIKIFHEHKMLFLGLLRNKDYSQILFIQHIFDRLLSMYDFYKITQASFMQTFKTTHSHPS